MRKWIDLKFDIGETVFIKTDADQKERIVVEITLKPTGILYGLCKGDNATTWHYDFELSQEVDEIKKLKDSIDG